MKIRKNKNLILQKITGLSKEQLFLKGKDFKLNQKEKEIFDSYISRLNSGEPIEYILEKAEFYGLDFFVDKRVLIPRDDTEIMVEKVLETSPQTSPLQERGQDQILIDVGTGSSCIAISILNNSDSFKKCYVIDISKKALEVSKINIEKYGLEDRVEQINTSLLNSLPLSGERGYNLVITANLPYIKNGDFKNIDDETMEFEPDLALYGGENTGFELYEKLIKQCLDLKIRPPSSILPIKKGGINIILFIEIGFDQKEVCENFLKEQNLSFKIFKDSGGVCRCVRIDF